jgi:SAM-dependent methyltransferase
MLTPAAKSTYGDCAERVYHNAGNAVLFRQLDTKAAAGRALDCGCGAGDNAGALQARGWVVEGITLSAAEKAEASRFCSAVWVHDLETGIPDSVRGPFDLVVMSHVLEHLRNPDVVLQGIRTVLAPDGVVLVALPNILHWRYRMRLFAGRFEYEDGGIMDNTHLRFYTHASGKRLLENNGFEVLQALGDGNFPLPYLRKAMPEQARRIDQIACDSFPGLFGWQLIYRARMK